VEKVLDFEGVALSGHRYRPEAVDGLAAEVADLMAQVFKEHGWQLDSSSVLATAGGIALAVRRLVELAMDSDEELGSGRLVVKRYEELGDIRVYLDLGGVRPVIE
jgi:hypothetical protein